MTGGRVTGDPTSWGPPPPHSVNTPLTTPHLPSDSVHTSPPHTSPPHTSPPHTSPPHTSPPLRLSPHLTSPHLPTPHHTSPHLRHISLSPDRLPRPSAAGSQQTHNVNTTLYNVVRRLFSQRCEKDVPATLPQCKVQRCVATCTQRCKITLY